MNDTHDRTTPIQSLTAHAAFIVALVASAALGCGGGGGSGSGSASTGTDTGTGSTPGTDSGSGDAPDDFFNDFDDLFDDTDGDGIPDFTGTDDDFLDGLMGDATLAGTFTGAGAGFDACASASDDEFMFDSTSVNASFTFDGAGNVSFRVEYVSSGFGVSVNAVFEGSGVAISLGGDDIAVSGNATLTSSSSSFGGFGNSTETFETPTGFSLVNVNNDAGTADLNICGDESSLIPLRR